MATTLGTAIAYEGERTYAYFAKARGTEPKPTIASSDANSTAFTIPRATGSVTFVVPALDGVSTTVAVQLLTSIAADGTQAWSDIYAFDPGDGTTTIVGLIPENQVTVIPASALGSGVFRLTAVDNQTTASTVTILFDRI